MRDDFGPGSATTTDAPLLDVERLDVYRVALARFFAIARGSATECAAILDIVRARGLAPSAVTSRGRSLLVRVVQMLTRLCQRLEVVAPV